MPHSKLPALLLASALLAAGALVPAPALAYTPVSELKDVSPDHWAYGAIQALVEKYEVMEGMPDRTFRGAKTLTRYELAAALAKVMAKVEELISTATGQPITVEPGVNPEDLRTIARLQREFRDELEVIKGRVDTLDTRVNAIEKRVRWGGELRAEIRDFLGAAPMASAPLAEMRVRNRLNMDASLTDELTYKGSLFWDVYGNGQLGNAFARNPAAAMTGNEVYLYRSFATYKPGWASMHAGLVNLSEVITIGSTLKDPFTTNVWREATGGYGFVGTPGMPVGGQVVQRLASNAVGAPPDSNAVWWLPGTDVSLQAIDPNATQLVFPRSNLTAAASGDAGPFNLGLAVYQPGLAGRDLTRFSLTGLAPSLPTPEFPTDAARMVATLGADFGFVRAQLAAKSPETLASNLSTPDKTVTGTLDIGTDALGLSLQAVGRTAFTGADFALDRGSVKLASNDLFGTGFGLGLGLNTGTALAPGATSGAYDPIATGGRSLLQGLGGADYTSYGLYLRIPGFSILPSLTLAAQQTGSVMAAQNLGDTDAGPFGATVGAGLTAQAEIQLFQLPRMVLEYSAGKFDPITGASDNALLNNTSFVSHEQLTLQMVVPF